MEQDKGTSGDVPRASTYKGYMDLFLKWGMGYAELDPVRPIWDLRVTKDVLIRRMSGGKYLAAGVPIRVRPPRHFWYLVTLWRGRLGTRRRLEDYGGVPCMPFELIALLQARGRMKAVEDLQEKTRDIFREDGAVFDFLGLWLAKGSADWTRRYHWRNSTLEVAQGRVTVAQNMRGYTSTVIVAELGDNRLHLLGQVRRNKNALWVRDALYVQVGRGLGKGRLPPSYQVLRMGEAGVHTPASPVLPVKSMPRWPFEEV